MTLLAYPDELLAAEAADLAQLLRAGQVRPVREEREASERRSRRQRRLVRRLIALLEAKDVSEQDRDEIGRFTAMGGKEKVAHLKTLDKKQASKLLTGHNASAIRELQRHAGQSPQSGKKTDLLAHTHGETEGKEWASRDEYDAAITKLYDEITGGKQVDFKTAQKAIKAATKQLGEFRPISKKEPVAKQQSAAALDLNDPAAVADAVHAVAREVPAAIGGHTNPGDLPSWQTHKPLVADVYDAMRQRGQLGGVSLEQFKDALLKAHLGGDIELSRNDLPHAVADTDRGSGFDRAARSEILHGHGSFHVLNTNKAGKPKPAQVLKQTSPAEHARHVADAVKEIAGDSGLAPLHKVRAELSKRGITDRSAQDAAIQAARKQHVTGSNIEGRHGITDEERAALLHDGEDRIGFLSLREEAERDAATPVATAYERGIETIQSMTETAVRRMLSRGDAGSGQTNLFSAEELATIAAAINSGATVARAVGEEEARRQIAERTVDAELSALGDT